MRRATGIVLASLLAATAVVLLLPAETSDAAGCIRCPSFFVWTPGQWGMGSTCAQAESNAIAAAYNYAYSVCNDGVCGTGAEEIVTPCSFQGGMWKADGRVQYKCAINLCF